MALSIDYLYNFCKRLIRKNQAGGLSSTDFQIFFNDAQGTYQDDLLGRWQARNSGKTGLNTGLIEDETIIQKLSAFIKPLPLTITTGTSEKPADFVYRLALRINGVDVFKINHNQIATINASVIDPPSIAADKYYFVEYGKTLLVPNGYYLFLPNTVTVAVLDYISTPVNVVWGFTYDADDRQVYNASTSVQSQWDSNSNREITKRVLTNLGVSFKDSDFLNFGKSVQLTGE